MAAQGPSADERLIELECRYAELERLFEDLNSVVLEQQAALEGLQRETAQIKAHLRRIADDQEDSSWEAQAPPPPS
ncbi:MAG: SlyX family protein [Planctomycetota bacterium]